MARDEPLGVALAEPAAPDWARRCREQVADTLLAGDGRLYPCYFGVEGERRGWNAYTWVDRDRIEPDLRRLASTLAESLAESRSRSGERRSLVCLVGPPRERTLEEHRRAFWAVLQALHGLDAVPWPAHLPLDPADPGWRFCFAGEPIFVFGLSPAFRRRRSRAVADCLVLVFQSETVFDGIGGSTPAGRAAKRRIRELLDRYDAIGPHPALGDAERSSDRKWRQYFLPDDQGLPERCPLQTVEGRWSADPPAAWEVLEGAGPLFGRRRWLDAMGGRIADCHRWLVGTRGAEPLAGLSFSEFPPRLA